MSSVLTLIESPSLLSRITPEQKSDLFKKLEAVQAVLDAGWGKMGDAKKIVARHMRVSEQAVQGWVNLYQKKGAEALVDGRRRRGEARGIAETTRAWIFEEFCRLQREDSGTEIYKLVRERARLWFRTGNPRYAIPGFIDPPAINGKGYPDGLSVETIRKCGPEAYQRALAHQGRKSASDHLPSIPLSRFGVSYLERIFFDDQVYDHYIRELGFDKPMRPVGFNALDFLTGAFLDFHIRLRYWDTDSKTHKSLTQREFVWFVIGLLSSVGYRTDSRGTRLVFEWGTANSWSSEAGIHRSGSGHVSFDDALKHITGGHVEIDRSGKFNQAICREMLFKPSSAGNFRYKSPLESMFRAVRTHGLLIPGPTGRNADLMPAENYGLEAEEKRFLKLANKLPAHLAESVRSNLFSFMEYYQTYRTVYAVINGDPEHDLRDWEKCGFAKRVWKWQEDPDDLWRPRSELAALPDHIRATHEAQLARNPDLVQVRRMSRAEAVRVSENDTCIRTLSKWQYHALLPMSWAVPVKVRRSREIVINDPLLRGTEALTYMTTVRNERGHVIHLQPGDELLCHVNPFRPDELMVLDSAGLPIGFAARRPDDVLPNSDLAKELLGSRAMLTADLDAPVRHAFATVAERRGEVRAANEALEERMKNITPDPAPVRTRGPVADPLEASPDTPPASPTEDSDPFA